MNLPRDIEAEALERCDRDPIHIPGTIQPFGCLIAADAATRRIEYASENVEAYLGRDVDELLGGNLDEILDREGRHGLANVAGLRTIETQRTRVCTVTGVAGPLFMAVHRRDGRFILEFQPEDHEDFDGTAAMEQVRWGLAQISGLTSVQAILEEAVKQLRGMSAFDRVKAYVFLPDDAGEVVAESRSGHIESFLGLRFPSHDIPSVARTLYRTTPIRLIGDVEAENVPIRAVEPDAPELDQSLTLLRGTMPVHVQYLRNMGVCSTISLPILVDGELWGLFAFHNYVAVRPGPVRMTALELAGKMLSLQVDQALRMRRQRHLKASMSVAGTLVAVGDSELSTQQYWERSSEHLSRLIPSSGVAFRVDENLEVHGECPPAETCIAACERAAAAEGPSVLASDAIDGLLPGMDHGPAGGTLVIPLEREPSIALAFFRNPIHKEVSWAGAPEKDIEVSGDEVRLIPRTSFALYRQSVANQCDSWSPADIEIAESLQTSLRAALASRRELREHRHRLGLLVRELDHRVRNILSLVVSLARRPSDDTKTVEEYADGLRRRLLALAEAHNLLLERGQRGAGVRQIVSQKLLPYIDAEDAERSIRGPELELRPDAASVLALVMHELTSNTAKYGALSQKGGSIRFSWRRENEGVHFRWRELGGPGVDPPSRRGFGSAIIEHAIAYELDGWSKMEFAPHGLEVDLWIPERWLAPEMTAGTESADVLERAEQAEQPLVTSLQPDQVATRSADPSEGVDLLESAAEAAQRGATLGKRALVVEDNFAIMMDLVAMLQEMGFSPVDSFLGLEAFEAIDKHPYAICVLDVNVRGQNSFELAKRLRDRDVPFVFATGYRGDVVGDEELRDVPVLQKPVMRSDFESVFRKLKVL